MKINDIKADELLIGFMRDLLDHGFKVYVSPNATEKPVTSCYFVLDDKIGHVNIGQWGGLDFSTVHKANRETGTAFRIADMVTEPTIDLAKQCFYAPHWATSSQIRSSVKYKSIEDYMQNCFPFKVNLVELTA